MADNVTLPGTGEDVATDDVGGVQYQIVKLADGTADSSALIHGDSSNGLDVDVTRVSGVVSVDDNGATLSVDDGGSTLSIDDGGGSVTVDGTVGVSGTVTVDSELTTADLDLGGGTDTRAVVGLLGAKSGGAVLLPGDATAGLKVDLGADNDVTITSGTVTTITNVVHVDDNSSTLSIDDGGGSITVDGATNATLQTADNVVGRVKLTDGTDVADVLDLASANPLAVAIVDGSGDQVVSFGGGVQYTEADTDSSITGTAILWEDTSDTLRAVSSAKPLPVNASGTPIPVTDNGGSLTVDDGATTLSVDDGGGSLTVDGSVTADTELTTADLDTGGGTDTRAVVGLLGSKSGGAQLIPGDATAGLKVDLGGDNDVRISDGTDIADVLDLTNSNPLVVAIVDTNGDQIASFGGGTQYVEGDTDASITGTAVLWEDGSDTLRAVSSAKPLPVNVVAGGTSGTEYTEGDTDSSITGSAILWEDAGDTLATVSSASPLPVEIIAGASSGTEYTEGDTDSSITGSAILWEDGSDTLRAVSAAKPLPVGDAGGTLTVDDGGTTLSVDDGGGTLTVDGSVTADTELTTADLDTGAGSDTRAVVGIVGSKSGGGALIPGDATAGLKVDLGSDNDVTVTSGNITADTELTTADLDTGGGTDTRAVVGLLGSKSGGAQILPGDATAGLKVDLGSDNDVRITDGTDVADVLDLASANPLAVAILDGSGNQITSFGGGTQYTEGDTDASITGTALLWEDTSDTLRAVSASKPLPVSADTELTTADLDTGGGTDTRAVVGIVGSKSGGAALIPGDATAGLKVDLGADNDVTVTGTVTVDSELTTADLDTGAGTDTRAVVGLARAESGGALLVGSANPLPIYEIGAGTVLAAQTTVTNSTTQIVGSRSTRKKVVITNRQSVAVYVGATAATTSMFRLDPGDSITLETTSRVDGITAAAYTASTDDKVHSVEIY